MHNKPIENNRFEKFHQEAQHIMKHSLTYRPAVVCIVGHKNSGTSTIFDNLTLMYAENIDYRDIIHDIGATFVPIDVIKQRCRIVREEAQNIEYKIPGLLFYRTELPGLSHDTRPWVYDFAIVVVDISVGLKQQTIESIRVLERRKTPFIVVLNKLDKLSNWRTTCEKDVQDALENQTEPTRIEFDELVGTFIRAFRMVKRETCLYYNIASSTVSCINLVPTSAKTNEGIENLLHLIVTSCQKSITVAQRLKNRKAVSTNVYRKDFIDGFGSTADCVPYNPKIQKVKGVHSIKIQARESDNAIEIEEIKSLHSVKVQPCERLNALDIEEVKGIRSVKIRAREDASANSNFDIAWGTDFYRRLFRIKMKLPQIEDNKAKKKKEPRDAWSIAIDLWVGIMTLSVFVMMIVVFVHYYR